MRGKRSSSNATTTKAKTVPKALTVPERKKAHALLSLCREAERAFLGGNFDAAATQFAKAIRKGARGGRIWRRAAQAHLVLWSRSEDLTTRRHLTDAHRCYRKCLEVTAGEIDSMLVFEVAQVHVLVGGDDLRVAASLLSRLIEEAPQFEETADVILLLSDILRELGEWETAATYLSHLLSAPPPPMTSADLLLQLGLLYEAHADARQAEMEREIALGHALPHFDDDSSDDGLGDDDEEDAPHRLRQHAMDAYNGAYRSWPPAAEKEAQLAAGRRAPRPANMYTWLRDPATWRTLARWHRARLRFTPAADAAVQLVKLPRNQRRALPGDDAEALLLAARAEASADLLLAAECCKCCGRTAQSEQMVQAAFDVAPYDDATRDCVRKWGSSALNVFMEGQVALAGEAQRLWRGHMGRRATWDRREERERERDALYRARKERALAMADEAASRRLRELVAYWRRIARGGAGATKQWDRHMIRVRRNAFGGWKLQAMMHGPQRRKLEVFIHRWQNAVLIRVMDAWSSWAWESVRFRKCKSIVARLSGNVLATCFTGWQSALTALKLETRSSASRIEAYARSFLVRQWIIKISVLFVRVQACARGVVARWRILPGHIVTALEEERIERNRMHSLRDHVPLSAEGEERAYEEHVLATSRSRRPNASGRPLPCVDNGAVQFASMQRMRRAYNDASAALQVVVASEQTEAVVDRNSLSMTSALRQTGGVRDGGGRAEILPSERLTRAEVRDLLKSGSTIVAKGAPLQSCDAIVIADVLKGCAHGGGPSALLLFNGALRNRGVSYIADSLAACGKAGDGVRTLCVGANELGCGAAKALAAVLSRCKLTSLTLEDNPRCGSAAGVHFGKALRKNPALTALALSRCGVGDAGVRALATALPWNKKLRSLSLDGNVLGDDAVAALAVACDARTSLGACALERINLAHNRGIGDVGVVAMANVARGGHLTHVARLDFRGTAATEDGARAFLRLSASSTAKPLALVAFDAHRVVEGELCMVVGRRALSPVAGAAGSGGGGFAGRGAEGRGRATKTTVEAAEAAAGQTTPASTPTATPTRSPRELRSPRSQRSSPSPVAAPTAAVADPFNVESLFGRRVPVARRPSQLLPKGLLSAPTSSILRAGVQGGRRPETDAAS